MPRVEPFTSSTCFRCRRRIRAGQWFTDLDDGRAVHWECRPRVQLAIPGFGVTGFPIWGKSPRKRSKKKTGVTV